jgi:hypothetical protein
MRFLPDSGHVNNHVNFSLLSGKIMDYIPVPGPDFEAIKELGEHVFLSLINRCLTVKEPIFDAAFSFCIFI